MKQTTAEIFKAKLILNVNLPTQKQFYSHQIAHFKLVIKIVISLLKNIVLNAFL